MDLLKGKSYIKSIGMCFRIPQNLVDLYLVVSYCFGYIKLYGFSIIAICFGHILDCNFLKIGVRRNVAYHLVRHKVLFHMGWSMTKVKDQHH